MGQLRQIRRFSGVALANGFVNVLMCYFQFYGQEHVTDFIDLNLERPTPKKLFFSRGEINGKQSPSEAKCNIFIIAVM